MRVIVPINRDPFHNNSAIIMEHKQLQQAEEINFTPQTKTTRARASVHKLVQPDYRHKPMKIGADPVQTICSVCPNHPIHPDCVCLTYGDVHNTLSKALFSILEVFHSA